MSEGKNVSSFLQSYSNTSAAPQLLNSLLTELVDSLPVVLVHSKPLTVAWPDVDVD